MPAFDVPANLAFDTYEELISAISEWLDRTDLEGSAPQMIALAESRMRRELAPLFTETSASVAAVDGLGALPSDYGTLNRVMYGTRTLPAYGPSAAPNVPTEYSEPLGYTVEANQLRLWPEGDWTVTLLYQPTLPQLSTANNMNDMLSKHPDAYFHGAMMFAEGYVANDNRASMFKALWDECLAEMKAYLTRQKFAGPLVPRVAFVP